MMLMVSPSADSAISDVKIDSGIEIAMISVLRQLPRNSRIIIAVSTAAISASWITPWTAALTNTDWSNSGVIVSPSGSVGITFGSSAFRSDTTLSVDASPLFRIEISTPRWPFWRTTLVCGAKPSRTAATSRR